MAVPDPSSWGPLGHIPAARGRAVPAVPFGQTRDTFPKGPLKVARGWSNGTKFSSSCSGIEAGISSRFFNQIPKIINKYSNADKNLLITIQLSCVPPLLPVHTFAHPCTSCFPRLHRLEITAWIEQGLGNRFSYRQLPRCQFPIPSQHITWGCGGMKPSKSPSYSALGSALAPDALCSSKQSLEMGVFVQHQRGPALSATYTVLYSVNPLLQLFW